MSAANVQPVIMCGGAGTQLWPLSRGGFPKQFLALNGSESLFQQALRRLAGLGAVGYTFASPLIVGNEDHRFLMLEQLGKTGIDTDAILLEPVGRNTAPALTLSALATLESGSDPVLVVTPADHVVADQAAFDEALQTAVPQAAAGAIIILGITPDRPETRYGYIHAPSQHSASSLERSALMVQGFVEKPDPDTARHYLEEGSYYWNSGMFVLKASVWMAVLERFRPDIARATRTAWQRHTFDGKFLRPGRQEFAAIPAQSADYAVIEKCPGSDIDLRMVPLAAGWNDLGAWNAVWQVSAKDDAGNSTHGDVLIADSRNTLIHATSRLVSIVGIENVVVIETPDAVLVADRTRSQEVKKIVAALDAGRRGEHMLHRKVHRPWGWYDSIDNGARFRVKRIQVNPKASLSLQMHHHRAEHWIIVKGTAEVTRGEATTLLTENQGTYIPLRQTHRLRNPGNIPLEIIEVQTGGYLEEDDIVRFDDAYGR